MVSCVICDKPVFNKETYTFVVGKFFHKACLNRLLSEYDKDKGYETA